MASEREDRLSIYGEDDFMEDSGRDVQAKDESVQAALQVLLKSGLSAQIRTVVQQQAALIFGEMAEARESTSSGGGRQELLGAEQVSGRSRQAFLVGGEIVRRLDPDDQDSNVDAWLGKIDQHGDVHGRTDYDRAMIMQSKLAGAARRWYHRLDDYNLSWGEWKTKLRVTFPRRYNFAVMLEELVARRKMANESMTSYYHAKLELCSRVGVKGERAVSCIIRGLPDELQANAYATECSTPEALYNQLLAGLEEYKGKAVARGGASSSQGGLTRAPKRRLDSHDDGNLIRCYNCQELGTHRSRDCPRERMERCWNCGAGGHQAKDCTKAKVSKVVSLIIKPTDSVFRQTGRMNGEAVKVYMDTGSVENVMAVGVARRLNLPVDSDIGDIIWWSEVLGGEHFCCHTRWRAGV